MILWFLRVFSQFRDLEALALAQARAAELQQTELESVREDLANCEAAKVQLINEKVLLEDRLLFAVTEKERLWESASRALDGERYALHTMVNHATQKSGGGIPYPDAHVLPAGEVRKVQTPGPVGRAGRVLPSQLAEAETTRFIQEFVESMNPEKAA